jgi:triosephosphate isomerase
MRRPLIAGNWKMNCDRASAMALARDVVQAAASVANADVAVCPPSVYLDAVAKIVAGSKVALGAQNVYHEANGAFTGEISTAMLCDLGCQYVILGHSERRHILGETDAQINKKLHAVLAAGLTPIVCVGELLAEREANRTADVIQRQFDGSLAGLSAAQVRGLVIAYEPVWAIGTGKVAVKPDNAAELLAQPNIDGALVGGASLKAVAFMGIVAGVGK